MTAPRCEGYRRHGGAFTCGPVSWEQCGNDAVVLLDVKNPDGSKIEKSPACQVCWDESKTYKGMEILMAKLIVPDKKVTPAYLSELLKCRFCEETVEEHSSAELGLCLLVYDGEARVLRVEAEGWPLGSVGETLLLDAPATAVTIVNALLDGAEALFRDKSGDAT